MKTHTKILTLLGMLCLSVTSYSATITNGDFADCSLAGWDKDTDGAGDIDSAGDFSTVGTPGNCAASINVDYFEAAGDAFSLPTSEAFFSNTLFQGMDFTAESSSTIRLDITLSTLSELTSDDASFIPDFFYVALLKDDGLGNYFDQNGELGFLVGPTDIDGSASMSFSFDLSSTFLNQDDWILDFSVGLGVDDFDFTDAFGSSLLINSVSLTEIPKVVNTPSSLSFFTLAMGLLFLRRQASK